MGNFVFYESWIETLNGFEEDFGKEYAMETLYALVHFAVTGEMKTEKKSIQNWITGSCMPNIISTKQRYKKAVENGKLGGRPIKVDREKVFELRKNGYTQNQIASELGCAVTTVRNILNNQQTITDNNQQTITDNNLEVEVDKEKENEVEVDKDTLTVSNKSNFDTSYTTFSNSSNCTTTTAPTSCAALSSNRKFTGDVIYNLIRIFGKEQYYEETKAKYIKWVNRTFPNISNYDLELLTCSLISLRTRNFTIERTSDNDNFSYWVIDALNHVKKNNILAKFRSKIIAEREQEEREFATIPGEQELIKEYNSSLELSKKVINASDYYSDDAADDGEFPF